MHNRLFVVFSMCIWWLGSSLVWWHCLCDQSHSTLWIELLTICNHDKFNNKLVWFLILVNIWHQKTIVLESWWHAVTLHVKPYCPNIRKIKSLTFDDIQVFFCLECLVNLTFKLQFVDAWTQNSLWFPLCEFHVSSSFFSQQNQRFTYYSFQGLKVMEETMFFDHEPCLVGEGKEIGDTFEL
jgi:hypothetical protein